MASKYLLSKGHRKNPTPVASAVIIPAEIRPDAVSHIAVRTPLPCRERCRTQPCTFICPGGVFHWNGRRIVVDYTRCLECYACTLLCPHNNILWRHPRGGYGVIHRPLS